MFFVRSAGFSPYRRSSEAIRAIIKPALRTAFHSTTQPLPSPPPGLPAPPPPPPPGLRPPAFFPGENPRQTSPPPRHARAVERDRLPPVLRQGRAAAQRDPQAQGRRGTLPRHRRLPRFGHPAD